MAISFGNQPTFQIAGAGKGCNPIYFASTVWGYYLNASPFSFIRVRDVEV